MLLVTTVLAITEKCLILRIRNNDRLLINDKTSVHFLGQDGIALLTMYRFALSTKIVIIVKATEYLESIAQM